MTRSAEEYAKLHKEAFRCAFDFLNVHFPPGIDADWWEQTAKDGQANSVVMSGNPLAVKLLVGVYEYLETEWKERTGYGQTDN